jgi:hypothetical protein
MPITHEDITELKKVFDDRYVLQSDCNERQEQIQKVLADDDKQIALILQEQKQMRKEQKNGFKFNNWLTAAILGALIVGFIGFYFFVS